MPTLTLDQLPATPMWTQYAAIKRTAPDSLLLYRMGDFYELFLEDAVIASAILNITLTSRNKGEGDAANLQMCGVPFHSATNYINRLLQAGKRVAICEQMENPAAAKGIVKREIVRVVSPGMAFDNDSLTGEQNNFLLILHPGADLATGAYCQAELSTGLLEYSTYTSLDQLRDELSLIRPREVLAAAALIGTAPWEKLVTAIGAEYFTCVNSAPDYYFSPAQGAVDLCRHFGLLNLEGFGLDANHPALPAVSAAFRAIREAQKQGSLSHLQPPKPRQTEGMVHLDESTIDHLDIFPKPDQNPAESLFHHLNKTSTAMGARQLREMLARPLARKNLILSRQEAVLELSEKPALLRRLREELTGMRDLERLVAKVGLRTAAPRDLQALAMAFARLPQLKLNLQEDGKCPLLQSLGSEVSAFTGLHQLLITRLKEELPVHAREGNIFRMGWHTELDGLIELTEHSLSLLAAMEERERASTGIANLKIKYNRVFGYYLEVSSGKLAQVPAHYIRKQTTATGERYLTPELKTFEDKILSAQEKRMALEDQLFRETLALIEAESQAILATARALAQLDAFAAMATAAVDYGYIAPEIVEEAILEIEGGRHPALERLVGREKFIANDLHFSARERTFLITGPNMAGKSTYMRQVALITLLAHTGSLVPARSAKIGLVDRIATRVGASDRIGRGQSTFMVEMNEMARILRQSSGRSLLIIDEIGRGTSTFDGLALAWAILEDILHRLGCRTLFATHYHELTALEERYSSLKNLWVAVEERNGSVVFLHEVKRGRAPGSYGIEVARLAGLPAPVVERAKEVLSRLDKGSAKLQRAQKQALEKDPQLGLFQPAQLPALIPDHYLRLEGSLRDIDIDKCTPLHALLTLKAWKDRLPSPPPPC